MHMAKPPNGVRKARPQTAPRTPQPVPNNQAQFLEELVEALKPGWAFIAKLQEETRVTPAHRRVPHTV